MASTRLTNDMREGITTRLLRHTFSARVHAVITRQAEFAVRVYEDVYPPEISSKLDALPAGWVPDSSSIRVQFGSGSGVEDLEFNGDIGLYGDLAVAYERPPEGFPKVRRRMIYSRYNGVQKVYEPICALAEDWDVIRCERAQLIKEVKDARSITLATLGDFTTVGSLIKNWPEVEPFARRYVPEVRQLPVVPRARLNAILDLPVEETSALGTATVVA